MTKSLAVPRYSIRTIRDSSVKRMELCVFVSAPTALPSWTRRVANAHHHPTRAQHAPRLHAEGPFVGLCLVGRPFFCYGGTEYNITSPGTRMASCFPRRMGWRLVTVSADLRQWVPRLSTCKFTPTTAHAGRGRRSGRPTISGTTAGGRAVGISVLGKATKRNATRPGRTQTPTR